MEIRSTVLKLTIAAATLAASAMFTLETASSQDNVTDAKLAVRRILLERYSKLGFADVRERPGAVCGWVHVRNAAGEDGRRAFVYVLLSEQALILDLPNYPRDVRGATNAMAQYCTA